jgi:formylglycine-generating enzyme required for sulfatase activity
MRPLTVIVSFLVPMIVACSGGGGNGDAGHEDGADGNGGDREPIPYACPFPFAPLQEHEFDEGSLFETHILCAIDFQDVHVQVLLKAVPTGWSQYRDPLYEASEAFVCRDGQVEALPDGSFYYEFLHHGWEEMGLGFDGYKFIFGFAEWCVGGRPCNSTFEIFDVRDLGDDSPVAEDLPALCSNVTRNGLPRPLVPLVRVPAQGTEATFRMGSDSGEADEAPVHDVTLRAFRLDQREATHADIAMFLSDHGNDCEGNPCVDTTAAGLHLVQDGGRWEAEEGFEDHPVAHMTWHGAETYCMWRSFRPLPTEAQWEYAASAGGTRTYPWGDQDPTCDLAVHDTCGGDPQAVCSHPAGHSREGVCDLSGNVPEWIRDWYAADYYATCTQDCQNPRGPEDPTGARVIRGGGYASPSSGLRAADRGQADPAAAVAGVRCASGAGELW